MGWPEAVLGAFGVFQVIVLAWIGARQQQVKKNLNGHQDYVTGELQALARLVRDRPPYEGERVSRRSFDPSA